MTRPASSTSGFIITKQGEIFFFLPGFCGLKVTCNITVQGQISLQRFWLQMPSAIHGKPCNSHDPTGKAEWWRNAAIPGTGGFFLMKVKQLRGVIKKQEKQTRKGKGSERNDLSSCARTEGRQIQGNPQDPQLSPRLPNWGKHLRLTGKWCKKIQVDLLYCVRKESTEVPRLMLRW